MGNHCSIFCRAKNSASSPLVRRAAKQSVFFSPQNTYLVPNKNLRGTTRLLFHAFVIAPPQALRARSSNCPGCCTTRASHSASLSRELLFTFDLAAACAAVTLRKTVYFLIKRVSLPRLTRVFYVPVSFTCHLHIFKTYRFIKGTNPSERETYETLTTHQIIDACPRTCCSRPDSCMGAEPTPSRSHHGRAG